MNRRVFMIHWSEDGADTERGQCVRIWDVPGTLSGGILRLYRDLPQVKGHFEIDSDIIRPLTEYLEPSEPLSDDSEETSDLVASSLPLIEVDDKRHFANKGKYQSEIRNLLACQGGEFPGQPIPENVIQLPGHSDESELVFKQMSHRHFILSHFSDLTTYKGWLLNLLDALQTLHLLGVVHCDLHVKLVLFSRKGGNRLVVCGLEGYWGMRGAPELMHGKDAGWSTASDVYDTGHFIECMVYANAPLDSSSRHVRARCLKTILQ